jgi:hypothetical protein
MVLDKQEYREMLEDICSEYCEKDHYCILKEFLVSSHQSTRLLLQLKCVDKFKFERSKENGSDLGWQRCMEEWVECGYAVKFAEVYDEKKSFTKIYKEIMGRN